MKANQKFIHAEDAVSPVIAVILMVAITVVLAATVFVLVNDLGKNVGATGPSLGLVSESATSSTSKWTVKVSSATQLSDLNDYRFVLTTPSHGTIVANPDATNSEFLAGYDNYAFFESAWTPTNVARHTTNETVTHDEDNDVVYHFEWTDIDGNAKYSVGDTLAITYNSQSQAFADGYVSPFATGAYGLEVLHKPSGASSASLPRTF